MKEIYDAVKEIMPRDKYGIPFYGTKSIHEMVSELANPEFREALFQIDYDKKSILQRMIDKGFLSAIGKSLANLSSQRTLHVAEHQATVRRYVRSIKIYVQ